MIYSNFLLQDYDYDIFAMNNYDIQKIYQDYYTRDCKSYVSICRLCETCNHSTAVGGEQLEHHQHIDNIDGG